MAELTATAPVARSPIKPAGPVTVTGGWEVSAAHAVSGLTITDCTPLDKVQVRAPAGGEAAAALGVAFGRAARNSDGALVIGSGPGEWLLIARPGQLAGADQYATPGEHVSWTDLTHGRALIRLTGADAQRVLARVCGIDFSDDITPDGSALRTSVANLATDLIRDDLPGGTRSYFLHCERSSGQYLFDVLVRAGAEYGIQADGFRVADALPGPAR